MNKKSSTFVKKLPVSKHMNLPSIEENLSMLASIVESSDDAIISQSTEGKITSWNKAAERLYGYTDNEIIGKSVAILMPPNKKNDFPKILKQLHQGKRIEHYNTQRMAKDGHIIDVSLTISPLKDATGHIIGASKIARDITEQKQVDLNLRFLSEASKILSSSLNYKATLSSVAKLCVPAISDWCAVDILNEQKKLESLVVMHKDPEKIKWAKELRRQMPTDMSAKTGAPNVLRTGKAEMIPIITDEMITNAVKDKKRLKLIRSIGLSSLMIVPLFSKRRAIGVIEFIRTESKRKFNEKDLAMAEELGSRASLAIENARLYKEANEVNEQLNIILQGVTNSIIVHGSDGSIVFANDEAAYLAGLSSAEELMEKQYHHLVGNAEIYDEFGNMFSIEQMPSMRALKGEKSPKALITYIDRKTKNPKWLSVTASPVFNEMGNVVFAIAISHDVTEQKEKERQKDEFMGIVSHELKTPVTSLKAYGQVLQSRFIKAGDNKSAEHLLKMDSQINKLTKLIGDLLDVTKIQGGKMIFHEEEYHFATLVDEVVEEIQRTSQTHTIIKEGNVNNSLYGDRERIGQVITNLLTNAMKYSPNSDRIVVTSSVKDNTVVFCVQDFGVGIPKEKQKNIFDRFYRETGPQEITIPGLGLGLYISSEIISRQHGKLWVESEKGKGSRFCFSLPLHFQRNNHTDEFHSVEKMHQYE